MICACEWVNSTILTRATDNLGLVQTFPTKMIYINTPKLTPQRASILYNNVTDKLLFVGSWVPPKTMPSNPIPRRRWELRVKGEKGGNKNKIRQII